MIGIKAQVSKQQRLPGRPDTAALRFCRYEESVELGDGFRIVELEDPALLPSVVLIEEAKAHVVLAVGSAASPGLERSVFLKAALPVEIVRIKNERPVFGVEDSVGKSGETQKPFGRTKP